MKEYSGHRSWNAWNVSLWINNDEPLYRFAMGCVNKRNNNVKGINGAVREFMASMGGCRTPDGAIYNRLSVRLCLQDLMNEKPVPLTPTGLSA